MTGQAKIYNRTAFTGLVDVSAYDTLITDFQDNLKRVEANLTIRGL